MRDTPEFKFCLTKQAKSSKHSFLPAKGEPLATGYDVKACLQEALILRPFQKAKISLGIHAFCPPGWWFELRPRSSTYAKKHLTCLYGVIDETFEGSLMFACQYIPDFGNIPSFGFSTAWDTHKLTIEDGEALGQLVPVKRQEMKVSEVSEDEYARLCAERGAQRGAGGFGSTDRAAK